MSNDQKKKRQIQVAVFVFGTGVLSALIAGISLYAQLDPDRELYDNDILFQELSSGAQMRLIAKFGPKPEAPNASAFTLIPPFLSPAVAPPTNVLVNNLDEDKSAQDTQSETTLVGFGPNIVVGFNDSGSFAAPTFNQFTGYSVSTDGGMRFTDKVRLPASANGDAGDPVLARDTASGTIYFATLMFTGAGIQCFRVCRIRTGLRWIISAAQGEATFTWFGETSDLRLRLESGSRVPRMVATATVLWVGL
jgi:hypothetical protein